VTVLATQLGGEVVGVEYVEEDDEEEEEDVEEVEEAEVVVTLPSKQEHALLTLLMTFIVPQLAR
jgi:hypothetical protein